MREKGSFSSDTYASRAKTVKERGGSATFEGEERARQGKGLDPLVDPSKYEVVRGSGNLLVPKGKEFILEFGAAMPVETDFDTTGSMGTNVNVAFSVLPKVQNLLVQGSSAVLKRYHTQIATGVIQDECDQFPYQRSMFEPDNEVERQMGLLVPEKGGGDATEDYQLGLFAAAYLTNASITKYGLRGYYFVVGDEKGRNSLKPALLERVFGPSVFEKAFGKKSKDLPSIKEVAKKLLENWHGFYLQVGADSDVSAWWKNLYGEERVIRLPRTEDVAEVQACIIGLTEGVIDLQNAVEFLSSNLKIGRDRGTRIVEAVRGIPVGLQTTFPNFKKIPMAGARFASREDIWPIGTTAAIKTATKEKPSKSTYKL